jgi:hypothetical protein
MRTSKHIEQLAGNIHFRPDEKTDERILAEAEAALSKRTFPDTKPEKMRIIIMRNPIIRIAVAAVVVIACVIGLSLWRTTGSGIALADVLARIEQVKAFRHQTSTKITGEEPNKPYSSETRGTRLISQEYGSKNKIEQLDPNGGWSTSTEAYTFPHKKTMIIIMPKEKEYWRIEVDDVYMEQMWQEMNDPRTLLKKIVACKHESLGRSTIDGIEVEGFQTTDPNWLVNYHINSKNKIEVDVKMWADVKTRLPVRYDFTYAYFDQMGDKIIKHTHWMMHDFQWDVPVVDAAEFEPPPIPDGYTIQDIFPDLANEETAIQGLKQCVELLGKYPERIALSYLWSGVEKSETPAALRLKEELKGLTGLDKDQKKMEALKPMRFLNKFYLGLASKESAYYGKTVTPKDADKVLMRWQVSDNEYRVIFGDLHRETVTPAKLAKLEAALPK